MEIFEVIIGKLLNSFDFGYMLAVNIATYLFIKLVDSLNGTRQIPTAVKRTIAVIVGLGVGIVLHTSSDIDIRILLYSFILSLVSFDVIFKPLLNFLGDKINYKKNLKIKKMGNSKPNNGTIGPSSRPHRTKSADVKSTSVKPIKSTPSKKK